MRRWFPPYLSLLRLARTFPARNPDPGPILDWCNQHGLLGILPSTFGEICLHAREPKFGFRQARLLVTRVGGNWLRSEIEVGEPPVAATRKVPPTEREWEILSGQGYLRRWAFGNGRWTTEALHPVLSSFLPGLISQTTSSRWQEGGPPFPIPLSAEFFGAYSEPVTDFIGHAQGLLRIAIGASQSLRNPPSNEAEDQHRWRCFFDLRVLADAATPQLVTEFGTVYRAHQDNRSVPVTDAKLSEMGPAPLLSIYCQMILEDLRIGRRILECRHCDDVFVSSDPFATFCNATCRRNYHNARRERPRRRAVDAADGNG